MLYAPTLTWSWRTLHWTIWRRRRKQKMVTRVWFRASVLTKHGCQISFLLAFSHYHCNWKKLTQHVHNSTKQSKLQKDLGNIQFWQRSSQMFNLDREKVVAPGCHCEGPTYDTWFHWHPERMYSLSLIYAPVCIHFIYVSFTFLFFLAALAALCPPDYVITWLRDYLMVLNSAS